MTHSHLKHLLAHLPRARSVARFQAARMRANKPRARSLSGAISSCTHAREQTISNCAHARSPLTLLTPFFTPFLTPCGPQATFYGATSFNQALPWNTSSVWNMRVTHAVTHAAHVAHRRDLRRDMHACASTPRVATPSVTCGLGTLCRTHSSSRFRLTSRWQRGIRRG